MLFQPGQVKEITGIEEETFRHWRKALSPLHGRKGKKARFTTGDLLAILIAKKVTYSLGIRIGALSKLADELFRLCNEIPFPKLERSHIFIQLRENKLEIGHPGDVDIESDAYIVVNLAPLAVHIRDMLFKNSDIGAQKELIFPPSSVKIR